MNIHVFLRQGKGHSISWYHHQTHLTVLYSKFYQGIFGYQAMKWLISMQDLVIFEVYATPSAQIDCEWLRNKRLWHYEVDYNLCIYIIVTFQTYLLSIICCKVCRQFKWASIHKSNIFKDEAWTNCNVSHVTSVTLHQCLLLQTWQTYLLHIIWCKVCRQLKWWSFHHIL